MRDAGTRRETAGVEEADAGAAADLWHARPQNLHISCTATSATDLPRQPAEVKGVWHSVGGMQSATSSLEDRARNFGRTEEPFLNIGDLRQSTAVLRGSDLLRRAFRLPCPASYALHCKFGSV
eukprot:IDg1236t1